MTTDPSSPVAGAAAGQDQLFTTPPPTSLEAGVGTSTPVCEGLTLDELDSEEHRAAHVLSGSLGDESAVDSVIEAAAALVAAGCPEGVAAWLEVPGAYRRTMDPITELDGCRAVLGVFRSQGFGTQAAAVELTERMPHLASLDRDGALELMSAWYQFGTWLEGFHEPRSTLGIDAAERLLANTALDDRYEIGRHFDGAIPRESLTREQVEYLDFQRFCSKASMPAWTLLNSAIGRAQAHSGLVEAAKTTYFTSIASGNANESDYDELSWLCERTGDFWHARVIAEEGLATEGLTPTIADRLHRRAQRCGAHLARGSANPHHSSPRADSSADDPTHYQPRRDPGPDGGSGKAVDRPSATLGDP